MLKQITDIIFPLKCLGCGKFLTPEETDFTYFSQYFCLFCLKNKGNTTYNEEFISDKKMLISDKEMLISDEEMLISDKEMLISDEEMLISDKPMCISSCNTIQVRAASTYKGIIKESIHLLKYQGKIGLADPLGMLLFQTFFQNYQNKDVDFIVPIPLYRWRMIKRGFNQSFLLIRKFSKYWLQSSGNEPKWKINTELLIRKRNTKSQTGFNKEQRKENVRGAFTVTKKEKIINKHIVLVDDVHTTGATTAEAGKALLVAGASSVGVIVLAQT